MQPHEFPVFNACMNALSALLLLCGRWMIHRRNKVAHRAFMLSAVVSSTLFLASYLYYHFVIRLTTPYHGPYRPLYLGILLTHTVLAAAIVPMVLMTLNRALRERFDAHRRIARWTFPAWLYVNVTGVVIYFMLYW